MHFVFWQTTFQSSNRQTKPHSSLILVACLEAKAGWPQGTQTSHPHCYTVSKRFPGEGGKQHSCVVQSSGLTLMQKEKNTYQKILTEVVVSCSHLRAQVVRCRGLSFLGNPQLGFQLHPREPAWHLLGVCPQGPAGIKHPAKTRLFLRTHPGAASGECGGPRTRGRAGQPTHPQGLPALSLYQVRCPSQLT